MPRKQNSKPSRRPSPSPGMMVRIAEAKLRNAARAERPALEYKVKDATTLEAVATRDVAETLLDAFGTSSKDFLVSELNRLSNSQLSAGQLHTGQREMNAALAAIDGLGRKTKWPQCSRARWLRPTRSRWTCLAALGGPERRSRCKRMARWPRNCFARSPHRLRRSPR